MRFFSARLSPANKGAYILAVWVRDGNNMGKRGAELKMFEGDRWSFVWEGEGEGATMTGGT